MFVLPSLAGTLAGVLDGSRFFMDYRQGLTQSEAASGEQLPSMRTKEDFNQGASTKIRVLVEVFKHALSNMEKTPE